MKRTLLLLLGSALAACVESHGTPQPVCRVEYADGLLHWWIHHDTGDGACVYAELLDAREAPLELIRTLDQEGPWGVAAFQRGAGPCDLERILPPSGNTRVATGWVRSRDVDGVPDVEMDVVVEFPAYPEIATPATTDHVRVTGTVITPRGQCFR